MVFSEAAKKEKTENSSHLFKQDCHSSTFSLKNILCFCVEIEFEAAGHLSEIFGCIVVWTCAVIWSHQLPLCGSTLRLTTKLHGCLAVHGRGMVISSAV